MYYDNDVIEHHGVPGMKWGVRHDRKSSGSSGSNKTKASKKVAAKKIAAKADETLSVSNRVIKKGTKLNSVSGKYADSDVYRKNGRWMYTYNPQISWDSAVYKGPFSAYLVNGRKAQFIKEHQYEVVKDLKMPTRKERYDEFVNLYKNYNKQTVKDLESYQNMLKFYGVGSEQLRTASMKNLNTKDEYHLAYDIFNRSMERSYAYKSTRRYSKNMSKKYDAMVDDNNKGVYNGVHDPVIIFKPNKTLKSIGSTNLSIADINSNYNYVRDILAKYGRTPEL